MRYPIAPRALKCYITIIYVTYKLGSSQDLYAFLYALYTNGMEIGIPGRHPVDARTPSIPGRKVPMNRQSTRSDSRGKASHRKRTGVNTPKKPSPDFPLSIHKGTGYWSKKVRGRVYYFGKVSDDPKGQDALEKWLSVKDDLLAGREPRPNKEDELAVRELCNRFLSHKKVMQDNGELNPRTFQTYHATCSTVVKEFGRNRSVIDLIPDDFRKLRAVLAKTRGAVALRNEMQRVRSIFKFAFDDGLILAPVRFGQGFQKPKLDVVRRAREEHRAVHGDRMFEAYEIRKILAIAKDPIRTMVLLATNCGFGQSDLSSLPTRAVNLDTGWLDFARVKTAVRRRVWLWPETTAAIREWLPQRPKAKDSTDNGLLFLTCRGQRWVKTNKTGSPADALGQEFAKLLKSLGLKRPGVSFYALRHTFETIAGESRDQVAVNAIMGHVDNSMASHYRERVSDERLRAVVETVRAWLIADVPDNPTKQDSTTMEMCDSFPLGLADQEDDAPILKLFVG